MHESHEDWKGYQSTRRATQTALYCGGRGYWRTLYDKKPYNNGVKIK